MNELQDLFERFQNANRAGDANATVALLRKLIAAAGEARKDRELGPALSRLAWNPKDVPADRLLSKREAAKVETLEAQLTKIARNGTVSKRDDDPRGYGTALFWPKPRFTFRSYE